ncbi:hypothetical protein FS842_009297 [Serendipita sp. 407]|nr:hypothetical protein FS842_009297 [Serendipita sp. 407]
MESLRADSRSLTTLVGITQGDMRGCLNTLQLLRTKHSEITELVVRRATVGMKESEGSLMSVVTDIFTPLSKSRVKDMGLTSEEEAKYVKRLSRAAESTGSVDRIALACFEHYLNYRIHDANFKAYEKAHTWLAAYETFNEGLWQDREYAIMPYLAYTLIPFHPIFSTKGGPKLERPKADWEAFQKQKTYEEIYRTISRSVMGDIGQSSGSKKASSYRHLVAKDVLPLEFAPLLNRIISPPLKPVNRQIIKPEEKVVVSRLVDIMVALDLRFVQEKQDDGVLVYRLEPPIDVFVTYDEKRAPDIAVTRYATRQLIASEIDARVIERQAEAFDETSKPEIASFFNRASVPEETELSPRKGAHEEEMASSPPSASRKLKTDEPSIDIADKPPVDFFGRLVTPKHSNNKGDTVHGTASKFKAAFKFNEGMSAAVRKPVKITSLLS